MWTVFVWLRAECSRGLLWTRQWTLRFYKRQGMSWAAYRLSASKQLLHGTSLIFVQPSYTDFFPHNTSVFVTEEKLNPSVLMSTFTFKLKKQTLLSASAVSAISVISLLFPVRSRGTNWNTFLCECVQLQTSRVVPNHASVTGKRDIAPRILQCCMLYTVFRLLLSINWFSVLASFICKRFSSNGEWWTGKNEVGEGRVLL
jgi:hypothetical protein